MMRRVAPCLILLLAPSLAWAMASGGYADPDRGTCIDPPQPVVHDGAVDTDTASSASTGTLRTPSSTTQGGGNDSELIAPRTHMPRWHSFLPGMFR